MTSQNLSYQELLQLVELIKSSSQFREFRFRSGDIELELRRGAADAAGDGASAMPPAEAAAPVPRAAPPSVAGALNGSARRVAAAEEPVKATGPVPSVPAGATVIRSPMVGTFYRAPEPGAAPFVEVGGSVDATTTVCIIEVMKLMNSIPAGCRGVVSRILVEDGEAVEYGQDLIVITPA